MPDSADPAADGRMCLITRFSLPAQLQIAAENDLFACTPHNSYSRTHLCPISAGTSASRRAHRAGKRRASGPPVIEIDAPDVPAALGDTHDDDERIKGIVCPSDDDEAPVQLADQDGELADARAEAAEDEVAEESSGASAERKRKAKAERLVKRKEKEDKEWIDLTEDVTLPAEHERKESTAPERGGPSDKIKRKPGDHPIEYFREFWPLSVNEYLADNSNKYAAGRGAGGTTYPNFKPFTAEAIDEFFGLLEYCTGDANATSFDAPG